MQKERKKLQNLIEEDKMWDSSEERCFVDSMWQALESLYAKEAEAAQKRGGARSSYERFEDLNEDIRRDLMRCKTRILAYRHFVPTLRVK
jgi:CRISPR-associated protein Cas8a1/Csx13